MLHKTMLRVNMFISDKTADTKSKYKYLSDYLYTHIFTTPYVYGTCVLMSVRKISHNPLNKF